MNYNLKRKNSAGTSWTYGSFKKNQYGNFQASFKVSALKELIELAEKEGKEWVNLSAYENKGTGGKVDSHSQAKANGFTPEPSFDLSDEIPF